MTKIFSEFMVFMVSNVGVLGNNSDLVSITAQCSKKSYFILHMNFMFAVKSQNLKNILLFRSSMKKGNVSLRFVSIVSTFKRGFKYFFFAFYF